MTTDSTRALVEQMREALAARRAFDVEPECAINRKLFGDMDAAIAAADQWLQQPGQEPASDEEIQRLFLDHDECKTYSDGMAFARAALALRHALVPLTERQIAVAFGWKAGHGPLFSEVTATRIVERAHGITGEPS